MDDERLTQELRTDQVRREARERELEHSTDDEHEAAQHARRADKAQYLRQKLEQRERSERDASP
jgi:hypothetical protein